MEAGAAKALRAIGFTHGLFNVEARVCPSSGHVKLIEVNPRMAGQFDDLFERVDGTSLYRVLLALESGEAPEVRKGAGRDAVAASFVWRDLQGSGLSRWPTQSEIAGLRSQHAGTRLMVYPKRGADLARERKWLGSYRYAVANLGAASVDELVASARRLHDDIRFHPPGATAPA